MIQIALINCQPPPDLTGPVKPPGTDILAGGPRNEFKEVLNKVKQEGKSSEDPAVKSTGAYPVNYQTGGEKVDESSAEPADEKSDPESQSENIAPDTPVISAAPAAILLAIPVETKIETTEVSTEAGVACDASGEADGLGTANPTEGDLNLRVANMGVQADAKEIAIPETQATLSSAGFISSAETEKTSTLKTVSVDENNQMNASANPALPGEHLDGGVEKSAAIAALNAEENTEDTNVSGQIAEPSTDTILQSAGLDRQNNTGPADETGMATAALPEMNLKPETVAAQNSPEAADGMRKNLKSDGEMAAESASATAKSAVDAGEKQDLVKPNSAATGPAPRNAETNITWQQTGKTRVSASGEYCDTPAMSGQTENQVAESSSKLDVLQGSINLSTARTGAGLETQTAGSSRNIDVYLQQIARELDLSVQTGKSFARIQLHPKDLGAIDIHLSHNANGIGITILAEQSSTGRLLESQMENLRQTLTDAGLQLTHMNFGMKEQNAQSENRFLQNFQTGTSHGRYQKLWSSEESHTNMEMPRMNLGSSLVDYRI